MLNNLTLKKDIRTFSVSPENLTGEKGKGGMATEGSASEAARELGQGWKVSPLVRIEPGEVFTMADYTATGDKDYAGMKCYPASYDGVISVGAVDEGGNSCVFSQYNEAVDISAPGSGLSLLSSGGGYVSDSGTSFSTAYVSGAAALALSYLDEGKEFYYKTTK